MVCVRFAKYQALGNDYLIVEPAGEGLPLSTPQMSRLCDRHYGVGADGVLTGPLPAANGAFGLRIFNPDGSESAMSGNGLRLFARYLWDRRLVGHEPFALATPGRVVRARVHEGGRLVTVAMGRASFDSQVIPVTGPARQVLDELIELEGQPLRFSAVSLGNPHCVIRRQRVSAGEARRWGPLVEHDPRFPQRTNVQFVQVLDRANIRIEIWERGAGYTLASGSSSCAAAAVAHRLGWCDGAITVHMPGGQIEIVIGEDGGIEMTGPVAKVCEGVIADEVLGGWEGAAL